MGGSAYGAPMFNPATADGTSPFARVLQLLRTEQDSKRGLLPIFTADELAVADNPDMSCVVALHLLVRDGRVHMVCYMRANDCDRGVLSDTFSFTVIQEFAAVQLGLELGTYTHHIGSAHVGERDVPRIRRARDMGRPGRPRPGSERAPPSRPHSRHHPHRHGGRLRPSHRRAPDQRHPPPLPPRTSVTSRRRSPSRPSRTSSTSATAMTSCWNSAGTTASHTSPTVLSTPETRPPTGTRRSPRPGYSNSAPTSPPSPAPATHSTSRTSCAGSKRPRGRDAIRTWTAPGASPPGLVRTPSYRRTPHKVTGQADEGRHPGKGVAALKWRDLAV